MDIWALLLLAGLGAYHGINPAMGWLFAVALGMQERDRRAVLRALLPIAIGHELALVTVVIAVLGLGLLADSSVMHLGAGIALVLFGLFRFVKPRAHFRWTKVRVNRRELTLVVVPDVDRARRWADGRAGADRRRRDRQRGRQATTASRRPRAASTSMTAGFGLLLHVAAMIAVMGVIAVLVYDRYGLSVLRKAWINLDWVWAAAFVGAGMLTLFT